MFAMAGSHRSGKTTTARAVADRLGIEFLETKVTNVFEELSISPKADLGFVDRLSVQNYILNAIEAQYNLRLDQLYIADRSPFDVMAYTMADIRRDTIPEEYRDHAEQHFQRAIRIVRTHLRGVMMLYPLTEQAETPGKAQSCPFYMDHVYCCVKHIVDSVSPHIVGLCTTTAPTYDLSERIEYTAGFFGKLQELYKPEPKIWTPNS